MTNLMQTEVWTTREGLTVRVDEMELPHLVNTVAFLERKAPQLELRHTMNLLLVLAQKLPSIIGQDEQGNDIQSHPSDWQDTFPRGEMAIDAFEREMNWRHEHPVQWLHTLPLVRRMDELINEKGETV